MPAFNIQRIEDEPQDDPRRMSPNQIRAYARQGGLQVIAGIARRALESADDNPATAWPLPLHQRGISCQTVAVINGIRCYQAATGGRIWNPDFAEVAKIRREAGRLEGRDEALTADAVARLFVNKGLLSSAVEMQQPITAVETMAANSGFAVITSGEAWHATTVVPNLTRSAAPSGWVPDFVGIDSLGGGQTGFSVDEFCATMLGQDWAKQDQTLVCTV